MGHTEAETVESPINNIPVIQVEKDATSDHYNPTVRLMNIPKLNDGSCGFDLSRSKWDPYPWVSSIDKDSPAENSGCKVGDCVLEVNAEDVLGMRIADVANLVKSRSESVSLLLWNTGLEPVCDAESICCGPMPINLERLSASMQTILAALECPVCLDTIPPPVLQCQNGHLLCIRCRARSERCPICRERYSMVRCLLAEQVYCSVIEAFNIKAEPDGKIREKIFGSKLYKPKEKLKEIDENSEPTPKIHSHANKFLARIMGKASSVDNLSNVKNGLNENALTMKNKSLSLSTSEIFRPESSQMAIIRCPSITRLGELSSSFGSLSTRRPRSYNNSAESLPASLPRIIEEKIYCCPASSECSEKIREANLAQHVHNIHQQPTISFGTGSAEISLPPRAPIDNACLILVADSKQFWLKLISDCNSNLFVSCLMQSTPENCSNYILEVVIRKSNSDKILGKELITRTEIFSLENKSWKDVCLQNDGIQITHESIQLTFPESEVILKVIIKRRDEISM